MIGMRMLEAKQLAIERRCFLLGQTVVRRAHEESTTRSFFGCVRQRHRGDDATPDAHERAAALMRIGCFTMAADGGADPGWNGAAKHGC